MPKGMGFQILVKLTRTIIESTLNILRGKGLDKFAIFFIESINPIIHLFNAQQIYQ